MMQSNQLSCYPRDTSLNLASSSCRKSTVRVRQVHKALPRVLPQAREVLEEKCL